MMRATVTRHIGRAGRRQFAGPKWQCVAEAVHVVPMRDEDRSTKNVPSREHDIVRALSRHGFDQQPSLRLQQQVRHMSSASAFLPEMMQGFSIWGGSAVLLNGFHSAGIPYWACFSLINIVVRVSLFPLVLYSAHAASRFGKVAVELQFFVSMFQNDLRNLRSQGASTSELIAFFRMGMQSLRGIYKLHKINPLAAFLSPLMQLPFFIYVSVDLRKIVNGRYPELAQELTACDDSILYWVPDLTEPDPFYILPILAGAAMYTNVETALGRRNLAGDTASKADTGVFLKDLFQSFSIFMPCFASHNPAGVQIYLCTSFVFTMVQGFALRNEQFRVMVGLPSLQGTPQKPMIASEFVDLKKLELQADELRGEGGKLLGTGVLARNWRLSFPGSERQSTIVVDANDEEKTTDAFTPEDDSHLHIIKFFRYGGSAERSFDPKTPFIPGISASYDEMVEREKQVLQDQMRQEQLATSMFEQAASGEQPMTPEQMSEAMEKANAGERPTQFYSNSRAGTGEKKAKPTKLSLKGFRDNKKTRQRKTKSKRKK
ncbi:Membrane protein insertase YidC [Seminavis robusta]|uniref:Membrane protein insertase YidC n=1 Tax=Seminavis robusta TaxID=568900 RepID=A0A9N8DFE9_9STRA|nr:Membrane protein insertase YidC [Seminavis robusta]|eukprot:Sro43_g026210.1 Membrane protein insertase YidC (545) ;mRNA; f:83236-84870